MQQAHQFACLELALNAGQDYQNPLWDVDLKFVFTSPSGKSLTIRGFWNGGRNWCVRFSPDEIGVWTWETTCSATTDTGLCGQGGELECLPYTGTSPLYQHGPIQVAADGSHFEHRDGTPFFWLGDTAWNGVIRGDDANWDTFLTTRREQRFSVVQFVACHWRGDVADEFGEAACNEESPIHINPAFFQRLDHRVAMINETGLVAAPVALWSLLETDVGAKLPEADAAKLAEYIVARYDAHQVVWLLGGDGRYRDQGIDRWKNIGRQVFSCGHNRLVSLHPCGLSWVGDDFRNEDWYDFIGYQSGHIDGEKSLRWQFVNGPATCWNHDPQLPVINLEPNYEMAKGYTNKTLFTDYHVRRGAYWSLLISPTCGLTYGHDAIWNWNFETGPSEGHGDWSGRRVKPWHTGLETEGLQSMTAMREIFDQLDWTTLRPAPDLLPHQDLENAPESYIVAARNAEGTLLLYAPCGGTVQFAENAKLAGTLRIIDPRNGETVSEAPLGDTIVFPDQQDWLAIINA